MDGCAVYVVCESDVYVVICMCGVYSWRVCLHVCGFPLQVFLCLSQLHAQHGLCLAEVSASRGFSHVPFKHLVGKMTRATASHLFGAHDVDGRL
jgi:hypothetical protein